VTSGLSASPTAATERELLALLDTTVDPAEQERILVVLRSQVGDPAAVLVTLAPVDLDTDHPFGVALLDAMAPAQADVIRQALQLIADRANDERPTP
jgi:hypothetical protein